MTNLISAEIIPGVSNPLAWAIIIVGIATFVIGIWAGILQLMIFFNYRRNNRVHVGHNLTAYNVARKMLDDLGYNDIAVRQTSILMLWFFPRWGNRYSPRRKAIFLFRNIINSDTVTAVALATQKVGLVIQHKEREPKMIFRARWELWTRLAPNLFLPIITIGLLIDLAVNGGDIAGAFGYITLGFVAFAILYTIIAFWALYLVIPTERRAGQLAMEKIVQFNLLPPQYHAETKRMLDTYVRLYIADFLLAILNLVMNILYLAAKIQQNRR